MLALGLFVVAAAPAGAQAPPASPAPVPGFVPPYEIMRTVRDAGFDPLGPPLREGTIYVLRATDYRGILMRVVIDARTGAIRDANRIVPGPGNFGPPDSELGMAPPPYGRAPMMPPPYARPAHADMPLPPLPPVAPPSAPHPVAPSAGTSATRAVAPPLPRARPELAARKPVQTKPAAVDPPPAGTDAKPAAAADPKPAPAIDPKPDASATGPAPTTPPKSKPPSTLNIAN